MVDNRNLDDFRDRDARDGREFHESLAHSQALSGTQTSTALAARVLLVIAGIWLIIAPFVINYNISSAGWNDVILGIAVGVVALINMAGRTVWLSWLNFILGIWLIIAPFVLSYKSAAPTWNDVILGIIVCILAAWSAGSNEEERV